MILFLQHNHDVSLLLYYCLSSIIPSSTYFIIIYFFSSLSSFFFSILLLLLSILIHLIFFFFFSLRKAAGKCTRVIRDCNVQEELQGPTEGKILFTVTRFENCSIYYKQISPYNSRRVHKHVKRANR